MSYRHYLLILALFMCITIGCRKSESTKLLYYPSVYPYTDTFSGPLSVDNYREHDTIFPNYQFYVSHITSDSIVFISKVPIIEDGVLPDRSFNMGYKVTSSNTYPFANLQIVINGSYNFPVDSAAFQLSDTSLRVIWTDRYIELFRLSTPSGGNTELKAACKYWGVRIKH